MSSLDLDYVTTVANTILEVHSEWLGSGWVFHNMPCQIQNCIVNCGVFVVYNIDCLVQGEDPEKHPIQPELVRARFARQYIQGHIDELSDLLSHVEEFERELDFMSSLPPSGEEVANPVAAPDASPLARSPDHQ
jgi:hypothetical protein